MTDNDPTTKQCSTCKRTLQLSEFYRDARKKSGYQYLCKDCNAIRGGRKRTPRHIPSEGMKRCSQCLNEYPATLEYFRLQKRHKDGMDSWCKTCTKSWSNRYYHENAEYVLDQQKQSIERRKPQHLARRRREYARDKDKILAKMKADYHANKDKKHAQNKSYRQRRRVEIKAQKARSYIRNRDREIAKARQHYRDHPEVHKQYSIARRTRKHSKPVAFVVADWRRCLDYWHNCCAYCGAQQGLLFETKITQEHFIPLVSPDSPGTVPENMLPACRSCNSSKQDQPPLEWLTARFGKRKARQVLTKIDAYFAWLKEQE